MGSPTLAFPFWSFGLIWPCSPYSYATLPFPALTTPTGPCLLLCWVARLLSNLAASQSRGR
ncbi:hypothetical protein CCHR01_18099 [Colletotrichum chrysophilum]|uniref:Uncharacterized protein n=1 Tax=Colletotrichum chrysophilum TaxID=1836956 RepID=A0AAD9A0Q8_9PEZI|nr:hypothetical protein CCHR01_18099 [Colletotrichum chrysophilum]